MHKPKKTTQSPDSRRRSINGAKPLLGYAAIAKTERRLLKNMTLRDSVEQTEILLRAAKWMR